jgi:Flp pilus assembly protein TadG
MAKPHRQKLKRTSPASRRGATLVEFAMTAPIFLLFLLAAFEFGWMNVMRHTADNAAYEAARHVIVPGATAAEGKSRATAILNAVGARDPKITISPSTLAPETKQVTVTVEVPVDTNSLILPRFMKGKTLKSTSTLRTERAK